ncbi:MAG: hypothetical protein ABL993_15090 [Vicinamibacterales bacterium]
MVRRIFRPIGGHHVAVRGGDDSRPDACCFADEVVVDFPSVARAVDRVRRAFVAHERTEALPAAVQLSRREARDGATVPLDVSVRCTCGACGGRGETWPVPCERCVGRGAEFLRHQVQVRVPAGVSHGTRFYFSVAPRHDAATRIELRILVD